MTMITPSYLGETIEYSSLHACRSTLEDPTPNGDIITVNGNDGNAVETAPNGTQAATLALDNQGSPAGAGDLFGLAIGAPATDQAGGLYFVDDFNTPGSGANTNSLNFLPAST